MPSAVFPVRSRKHQTSICHADTKKKKKIKNQEDGGKKGDKERQVLTETMNNP